MTSSPTISVVLPVFNGGTFLSEAIESILDQTYTNFEFLMIDDGSTDSSLQVMQEYERKDTRIRLLTRENRGLVFTLNEMIDMARGSWIARMDSDDIALPNRFARQLEWLEKTEADVCGSWVKRFGSSDQRLVHFYQLDSDIKTELMFCSPFVHPAIMLKATLAKSYPYDETWIKAEDYDLWVRGVEAGWVMTNVPEVLLRYRIHAGQVSVQAAEFQQEQGRKIRHRYWCYVFQTMGLEIAEMDEWLKIFEPAGAEVDMNKVDVMFTKLLLGSDQGQRNIIFSHMTRLYILVAANCPDIVSRWKKLNAQFGPDRGVITGLQLMLFRLFRIRQDGRVFKWLKMFYVWRAAR